MHDLVTPGSSLGGARPKANVRDTAALVDREVSLAEDRRLDIAAWEFVYANIAERGRSTSPSVASSASARAGSGVPGSSVRPR